MNHCPKCKAANFRKAGIVKQRKRFFCKQCSYYFSVEHIGKPDKLKKAALMLYLEGLGFRSIGRFLNVSHVSVFRWIKAFGKKIEKLRSDQALEIVEIDEMHTFIGSKKISVGSGLLLIEMGNNLSIAKLVAGEDRQV